MTASVNPTVTYDAPSPLRQGRRAVWGWATALMLLQACNGGDALAPVGSETGVALPAVVNGTPLVSRVAPDTIEAGQLLVLTGQDLPTTLAGVRVTLGDTPLDVRAMSATRMEVAVPVGVFPCSAVTVKRLDVAMGATTLLSQDVPLRTAQRILLEPGQSLSGQSLSAGSLSDQSETGAETTAADVSGCFELVAAGRPDSSSAAPRFVMALVNPDTDLSRSAVFSVHGIGSPTAATARVITQSAIPQLTTPASHLQTHTPEPETPTADTHGALLQTQARLAGTPGMARRGWQQRRSSFAATRTERQVGDTVTMTALLNSCTQGQPVKARVVYAGTRALVLEDVNAPRAGRMDQSYRAIGAEFDTLVYPMLKRDVGDPLAMNDMMAGDGRVTMLFTRFVNDSAPGTAGYVSACNFHPRSTFAASNEDEVFYARTATLTETPDEWRRTMRATVVHEAKHLASFAERLARGMPFEETWLEEATARIAEELYARHFPGGGAWRGNTPFSGSLECELLQCDDRPLVMWRHFSQLYGYLREAGTLSPLGPTSRNDNSWYASGWSLVRFVLDRYVQDEGASLRQLVRGDAGRGLAALESVASTKSGDVLSSWALANIGVTDVVDVTGTVNRAGSWDVPSMWTGLAQLYAGVYDASPLRSDRQVLGSEFTSVQRVVAGGSAYVVLQGDGAATSQIVSVARSAEGTAPVWKVARVR